MRIISVLVVGMLGCGGDAETKDGNAPERWEGQFAGECSDEADNDRDGLFDCDDSDCIGAPNCDEESSDLDADGTTDSDSDGGGSSDDDSGTNADGDADGSTDVEIDDYEGDEPGECGDGIDNDRDGIFDCTDPGCATSAECAVVDTDETTDADDVAPGDVDGGIDADGTASACDEEETSAEPGEGEMEIRGWLTISGDVDLSSASCRVTTWPWTGINPLTGTPDLGAGAAMLGDACVECPGVIGIAVPFTAVLPVAADGEEVGVIAKIDADGRIYEEGTDSNPLLSVPTGDAEGFRFEITVEEPGVGDPLDPPDAGADLEPPDGPEAEPDLGPPDGPGAEPDMGPPGSGG